MFHKSRSTKRYAPEDFYDIFGEGASEELYSNSFSWIQIISVNNGKKHNILDMETT